MAEAAPPRANADPSLTDMAKRLQSVLKSPLTPVTRKPDPEAAAKAENIPIPLPSARPVEASHPEHAAAPVPQGKPVPVTAGAGDTSAIDSLEAEMARLLGRTNPEKT